MPGSKRWLVALAVVAAGGSLAAAVTPAAAAPAAATGSTSVTVFLKAPNLAALDRLASASGLTHAQRVKAVSALVPSAAAHREVGDELRAQGFRLTGETSWSITATGKQATSDALFGTRPTAGANASAARVAAATGALPRVPTNLPGVAAVFPTIGGPQAYHHSTALTGTDFRNADTPASVAPSTGAQTTGVTVATLQLADFYGLTPGFANSQTASDLTSYAKAHGIDDPVTQPTGAPRYQAIKVDGGPAVADDDPVNEGDVEVALDQESILSTAPSANQHAYFAPNTDAGYNDVFASVLDDVLGTTQATAPDPHLAALSVSWGACEDGTSDSAIATLEPILKSLLAAGVTVFASSGDDGIYDCGDSTSGVDYPASSPSVVGVGGSRLLSTDGSAGNTGTNWSETSWTCTSVNSCVNTTGGSGGGTSSLFPAPAYQQAGIDDAPFAGTGRRLVPDITADGDPKSGFVLYSSNPAIGLSHQQQEGGTSLASPISAAQLANTLADAGRTTGVGDIHPAIYSAYRRTRSLSSTDPLKAFRDVTVGTNGATAAKGDNPSVQAQAGYDTNSGVGGVLWSALLPYFADAHTPTATATLTEPHRQSSQWRTVRATWHVTTGKILAGPTQVTITADGVPVFSSHALPASGSRTFTARPGQAYTLTVTGSDIAGRESTPVSSTLPVAVDSSAFTVSKNWHRVLKPGDFGGSHLRSTIKDAPVRVTAVGHKFVVRVVTGPTSGRLGVYKGKKRLTTINLHSSRAGHRLVTIFTDSRPRQRTFTFRPMSHTKVGVDSLQVVY